MMTVCTNRSLPSRDNRDLLQLGCLSGTLKFCVYAGARRGAVSRESRGLVTKTKSPSSLSLTKAWSLKESFLSGVCRVEVGEGDV